MLRKVIQNFLGVPKPSSSQGVFESFFGELKKPWIQELGVKTAVDIGANVGDWSKAALLAFPGAKVYAFEPLPSLYEVLSDRFKEEGRFCAFDLAVSDKEGSTNFYQNDFSPSSSLLKMRQAHKDHFEFTANEKLIKVKTSKLDSVFEKIPLDKNIMIKMDVQGSELDVIHGGKEILSQAKVVVLEASFETLYEEEPMFDGLYKAMTSLGFKYHGQTGQLRSPVNGLPLQADCIYLRL